MKIFSAAILTVLLYSSAQAQLPPGKGGEVLDANCSGCHGLNRTTDSGKSKDDWKSTVDRMVSKGADVKPEEMDLFLNYLAKYFGEDINVNAASAKDLQAQLGVTAAQADAIVKARTAASFKAFADFVKVEGLDAKEMAFLKGRITFK